jgi:hypothetical protein
MCRSQWPRGLRRRSTAARLLRLWVRIPPGAWMFVCCVLSGRGLCDELIMHPEESYRLRSVVCDLETSWMRRPWPTGGSRARNKQTNKQIYFVNLVAIKRRNWLQERTELKTKKKWANCKMIVIHCNNILLIKMLLCFTAYCDVRLLRQINT